MKRILFILSLLLSLSTLFFSCEKNAIPEPLVAPEINHYLHISHTRTNSNPLMDEVAQNIDYSKFDMLWLGGDLAFLTSADNATMTHVDSIFDLGNPNTLWALGNHDYSDLNRVEQYTNRPPYYSFHKDGITFIVLDTQDNLSNITGAQKDFFDEVTDTIQESSHLVILHHKLIWMYGNVFLEPQISPVSNGEFGNCSYCLNPNNFTAEIYPKLVEVKEKGIEVLCIGGDIGVHTNQFEYLTPEGIYFLASGIKDGQGNNKALLFQHDLIINRLTWEFKLLTDL